MIPSFKHGIIASSRPRAAAAANDVTPNAVNWDNLYWQDDCDAPNYYQNTAKQITGITTAITLKVTWSGANPSSIGYKKSTSPFGPGVQKSVNIPPDLFTDVGYISISSGGTITNVSNNDYIGFMANSSGDNITISVLNNSDGDAVLDTMLHYYNGDACACLLTTSVVSYMNLQDNGPELTAMRSLREYYKDVPGYQQIIREYYVNSPAIIAAINALQNPSIEYQYIYNTVILVKQHVDLGEWQQAHDLYMAMYNDLKNRYMME